MLAGKLFEMLYSFFYLSAHIYGHVRFSASNISREYEAALTDHSYFNPSEWKLGNRLTPNHVWDGFIIYSLLQDRERRGFLLEVPHNGTQTDRFMEAMEERNRYISMVSLMLSAMLAINACAFTRTMMDHCVRVY